MMLNYYGASASGRMFASSSTRKSSAMQKKKKKTVSVGVCLASSSSRNNNPEQLRAQLDQLHLEADITRAKANNARMRLMRLSEAVEKLQRQAVISVQTGKENDARELLFQKKKVIQALEKSKSRIEVLHELLAKLDEAISARETELVETIGLDHEVSSEDASSPVRFVSPKNECTQNSGRIKDPATDHNLNIYIPDQADISSNNDPNNSVGSLHELVEGLVELRADDEPNVLEVSLAGNQKNVVSSLNSLSSYEDFLKHIDQKLNKIEAELVIVSRVSTFIMDGDERPENKKVQQTMEILEAVRHIRGRIANIMQTRVDVR